MSGNVRFVALVSCVVAQGGFLMGFDASVISGVVRFIEPEFDLSKVELGWAVASLTLTSTLAMMVAGPLSDRLGRRPVLMIAALLFLVSAVASALAPSFGVLVAARMLGGLGVGAALIIAPMYIAELAPAALRGRLVSLNQLNIVVGISAAFFSNFLILKLGQADAPWAQMLGFAEWSWRWMLAIEALPALVYAVTLFFVPESPRWLVMQGREAEALAVLGRAGDAATARAQLAEISHSTASGPPSLARFSHLFRPAMRLVLTIGIGVAVLQQITGINAVFFYAPMIFEQSGIGTDAAFMQAVFVGLVNLAFTVIAMLLIDRLGRRPLLAAGVLGVAISMFSLAWSFHSASYTLTEEAVRALPAEVSRDAVTALQDVTFEDDLAFKRALRGALGEHAARDFEPELVTAAIDMNATLVLFSVLGFVASFAVSLGPVMWVLFSELFPNALRGLAISFVGLINSSVSFAVQLVFPWELANFGNAATFAIFGVFAVLGLVLLLPLLPETRGRSLEDIEAAMVTGADAGLVTR